MPTVIDEFVVSIGLDPSKFTKEQKALLESFKVTQQAAVDRAKNIESSEQRAQNAISKTTMRLLGLFSLMVGGYGVKEFLVNQTRMNAETGRTAQMFETSTKALSAWRNLATLTGGTAAGITGAMGGLISQFQNFALTGESSVIPYFRALNVDIADASGRMRTMDDIMLDLADRFSKLDPAKARAFGQALGFDDATISLLIRGRAAVTALLAEAKTLGTVTKEDAEAAAELQKSWNALESAATSLGRRIVTSLTPAMKSVLDFMSGQYKDRLAGTPNLTLGRLLGIIAPKGKGSGAEPSEAGGGSNLRTKAGAGTTSIGTAALAASLQSEIPGLDRFTAFNDTYHQLLGRGSAHVRGQALDFTLKNAAESAAVSAQVRKKLADMGIDAKVIDEYANPSRGSTGGHIHVQFNSADAAARYSELASNGGRAAAASVTNRTSSSASSVTVGKVEITTQATDAEGIAKTIRPAIERNLLAAQAQAGPQ